MIIEQDFDFLLLFIGKFELLLKVFEEGGAVHLAHGARGRGKGATSVEAHGKGAGGCADEKDGEQGREDFGVTPFGAVSHGGR